MDSTDNLLLARGNGKRGAESVSALRRACCFLRNTGFTASISAPSPGTFLSNSGNVEWQHGSVPLADAVGKGDAAQVTRLLDSGVSPDAVENAGMDGANSALMIAAANNRLDIARLLLDRGADVNLHDYTGRSALYEAVAEEHPEMTRLLVRRGADVNADYDGSLILRVAEERLASSQSETERGRCQEIVRALEDAGASDEIN